MMASARAGTRYPGTKRGGRIFFIGAVFGNLMLIAVALFFIGQNYLDIGRSLQRNSDNLVEFIGKHIEGDLRAVEVALNSIVDEYASPHAPVGDEIGRWIATVGAHHQSVSALIMTDVDGEVVHASGDAARLRGNVADRDYFQRLRDNPQAGLLITAPLAGRISGKLVVLLSQRLDDANGRFAGVVAASIPVEHFHQAFARIPLGNRDEIIFTGADRHLIAAYPRVSAPSDTAGPNNPAFEQALSTNPELGRYRSATDARGAVDANSGVDRMYTYQRNAAYGFYVMVGVARADAFAGWWRQATILASIILSFALVTTLLGWRLYRTSRAQEDATEKLLMQEARLTEAQRIARLGHFTFDFDTGTWAASPTLGELFGLGTDTPRDRPGWERLLHPDDKAAVIAALDAAIARTAPDLDLSFRVCPPAGDLRWAHARATLSEATADAPAMLFGTVQDITERMEFEHKLLNSRELLRQFLDHFPGAAYVKDEQLRVRLANTACSTWIGLTPQEMIGCSNQDLFPGDFGDKITLDERRVLNTEQTETIEETWSGVVFQSTKFVIHQHGKRLLGGISLDVTARARSRQRAEVLLTLNAQIGQGSERDYLSAGLQNAETLTGSEIGFLHFVHEDQETIELVTWTAGALKGCQTAYDNHYPISQAGIWADCFRTRGPVVFNDYAAYAAKKGLPPGHTELVRLISVPVIEEGKVRMMLGVGNKATAYDDFDVDSVQLIGNDLWRVVGRQRAEQALKDRLTELTTLNHKLEQAQNQLLQSEKMATIGQLAAGVAHELNNPIGFVQSNLGTLGGYVDDLLELLEQDEQCAQRCPDPKRNEAMQRLRAEKDFAYLSTDIRQLIAESKDGADRVRKIVQNLKDFSHVSEDEWLWADLHRGLDSTLNLVWNEIKYKAEVDKHYGPLPAVFCVASQINQVFMNLLVNAAQAIESNGRITLRSGTDEGQGAADATVWIEISDTGKGIAAENLKRIFDPFFTTKPVGKGTGLGLSLAWSIIQKHHGTIDVHSTLGIGTTFRITLPVHGISEPNATRT